MFEREKGTVKFAIQRAFLELLTEKPYTEITVSEVVKRAGVARVSFYRNFRSLDDVIESIAEGTSESLIEMLTPVLTESSERTWREFLFRTFYFHILAEKESGISLSQFRILPPHNVVTARIHEKIMEKADDLVMPSQEEKYILIGRIGMVNSVARHWASEGRREPPEQIIDLIMSSIMKF